MGANRLLRLPLRSKVDREGRRYLFASIPLFDAVAFVFQLPEPDEHGNDYELVVKPFEERKGAKRAGAPEERNGQGGEDDDYSAAWEGRPRKPTLPRTA